MRIESSLVSDRIILRSLESDDITPHYFSWFSDSTVVSMLEVRFAPPNSIEDLAEFVAAVNDSEDTLMLGIFLQHNKIHIGNIKLGPINQYHSTADIGLLIGERDEWGKGYASAAIKTISDFAFSELGLIKLTAGCYASNKGSRRAFIKAGYIEEGRRALHYQLNEKREDAVLLANFNADQMGMAK
jgi:RimJ/RimL family protein N-acetyltransferase